MWAVVPVKDMGGVKRRLASALRPEERREFYRAMLRDTLSALRGVRGLDGVALLTRDREAIELARRFDLRCIEEPENRGHTAAVARAAAVLAAEGAQGLLQLPGDVPLATAGEIEAVLAAHGAAPAFTIVPSRDEMGSNCVVCSPPDIMGLRFGDDSFRPHLAAARAAGLEPRVLALPGIGLDIDTPEDLMELARRSGTTRSQRYLRESGIAARLLSTGTAPPDQASVGGRPSHVRYS